MKFVMLLLNAVVIGILGLIYLFFNWAGWQIALGAFIGYAYCMSMFRYCYGWWPFEDSGDEQSVTPGDGPKIRPR